MNTTAQLDASPLPASIDNPGDWEVLAGQISAAAGMPTVVTPELIVGAIGSAVPLLFEADTARNANLLRGTFADPVVAQCQRNAGDILPDRPISVRVHLAAARLSDGHPVVRAHVCIDVQHPDGSRGVNRQFWDLLLGAQVTVGQPECPNCGAPIGTGELICGHCRTDVRSVVEVPIVVSRLDLY